MCKELLSALSLLILVSRVSCQGHQPGPLEREDYAFLYLSLFGGIVTVALIRHLVRVFDVAIPYSVFCLLFGIIWAIGGLYNHWMNNMTMLSIRMMLSMQFVYLPILVFSIVFCIDVHAFLISLPQILIIGGPVAILSAVMTGSLMRQVIDPAHWTTADSIVFGTLLLAIYPMDALRCLRVTTIQTKHQKILLEGETIITAAIACTIFRDVIHHMSGWIVHWYQFLGQALRQLLIGVPLSYLYGHFGCFLMKLAFNDVVGLMLITLSLCYNAFFVLQWIANCGVFGTMIVGMMMGSKRTSFSKEMERSMTNLWKFISCIMNGILFLFIGIYIPKVLRETVHLKDYALVLVTYLVTNISRFVSYFLFSPILSRVGYGMTFQNMSFCVWAGIKNPISLDMALYLVEVAYGKDKAKGRIFFLHAVMVYMLTLCVNGSTVRLLIKALGLSELSFTRQINMNNCIKYIYEARARTAAILKMDRFLSDANWPLVMETTALKHPYRDKNQEDVQRDGDDNDEGYFATYYKYTFCPDCQRDIPNQPTPKELKEMTREAKLRVMKLRKSAYARLYENGMMSKEAIRILHQTVEVAMDTDELVLELDCFFRMFAKEGILFIFLRNFFQYCGRVSSKNLTPPRKWWRRRCHHLIFIHRRAYSIFMFAVLACHIGWMLYHFINKQFHMWPSGIVALDYAFLNSSIFFLIAYAIEFALKIYSLSWIYICQHGVRNYFRTVSYVLEFVVLCLSVINVVLHFTVMFAGVHSSRLNFWDVFFMVLLSTRLIDVAVSVFQSYGFCTGLMPSLIKSLESEIEKHRAMAFELAKNYIAAEEEILENLHQIIDNEQIGQVIKEKIENDKLAITRRLGIAEKESPSVAATVKTKLAINAILSSMREDAHELKVAGWVDDGEYKQLLNSLAERYKFIGSIKSVQPVPSKLIFREIPWMGEDDEIIDFLYRNSQTKKFEANETVFKPGDLAEAVYILISGMMVCRYVPSESILQNLSENGVLPIADYIFSIDYEEPKHDYIVPGNTVGESSILNGQPYNSTVVAETACHVYVLKKSVLEQAFEMNDDPVQGLECRIWKSIYSRQAMSVMISTPAYRSYTQDKINYILERAFVPNLTNYKVFVVNEMMADVFLVTGVAVDVDTRDVYTAPSYIPRSVQKLVLPKSSRVDLPCPVETKLMIIPAKDFDEYEIMVAEEDVCELVNEDSSRCVLHWIRSRGLETTGRLAEIMKSSRQKLRGTRHGLQLTPSRGGSSRLSKMSSSRVWSSKEESSP